MTVGKIKYPGGLVWDAHLHVLPQWSESEPGPWPPEQARLGHPHSLGQLKAQSIVKSRFIQYGHIGTRNKESQ